jgi:hypothetical protein
MPGVVGLYESSERLRDRILQLLKVLGAPAGIRVSLSLHRLAGCLVSHSRRACLDSSRRARKDG